MCLPHSCDNLVNLSRHANWAKAMCWFSQWAKSSFNFWRYIFLVKLLHVFKVDMILGWCCMYGGTTLLYKRVTFNVDFQVAAATINKNITILLTGEKLDGSWN